MIFQFKITLKDVGVPVWRRIQVESGMTFEEFHQVIQLAFEWTDSHLHEFEVRRSNGEKVDYTYIKPLFADEWETNDSLFFQPQKIEESQKVLADWFKRKRTGCFILMISGTIGNMRLSWRRY